MREATHFQTRDGLGNGDRGQTAAICEAIYSQICDGIGNGDRGQTAATFEATISQPRDGIDSTVYRHLFRDNHISGIFVIRIRIKTLKGHFSSLIFRVQVVEYSIDLDFTPGTLDAKK